MRLCSSDYIFHLWTTNDLHCFEPAVRTPFLSAAYIKLALLPTPLSCLGLSLLTIQENLDIFTSDRLVLTPILSVMVCPSLKPKSSFGPESPSWALLLNSFSCFTHLQAARDTHHQQGYRNKQRTSAVSRMTACRFKKRFYSWPVLSQYSQFGRYWYAACLTVCWIPKNLFS